MNIEITGRNYEVSDKIRKLLTTKLSKVTKYFEDIIEIRCVLNVEKYRNICEIKIIGKLQDTLSKQEADTMEDAVNSATEHIKTLAQKGRKKITQRRRAPGRGAQLLDNWTVQVIEPGLLRNEVEKTPRVIRTSNLPIRPMSIEQAAMMLDDSKNEFIVFRDLDTDKVTVIYKRTDQNFGMIAPEF